MQILYLRVYIPLLPRIHPLIPFMYRLRCQLVGHQGDVRTACSGAEFVATGSRDRTARLWTEETPGSRSYTETRSLAGHTHYVTAICYVYPTEKHPRGKTHEKEIEPKAVFDFCDQRTEVNSLFLISESKELIRQKRTFFHDNYFLLQD